MAESGRTRFHGGAVSEGVLPHEIGVFVRSDKELDRARGAVDNAGLPFKVLDENLASQGRSAPMLTVKRHGGRAALPTRL